MLFRSKKHLENLCFTNLLKLINMEKSRSVGSKFMVVNVEIVLKEELAPGFPLLKLRDTNTVLLFSPSLLSSLSLFSCPHSLSPSLHLLEHPRSATPTASSYVTPSPSPGLLPVVLCVQLETSVDRKSVV